MRLAPLLALLSTTTVAAPLEVRVLFGDQPAPRDTEVRLYEPSPLCGSAQRRGAPMRHPDAEGRVTFPDAAPKSSLVAEHAALGSISLDVDGPKPLVLRFPAGVTVDGLVLDDRGAPAAGAHVALVPKVPTEGGVVVVSNSGSSHFAVRSLVTTADGRFEFLGLAAGEYVVVAADPGDVIGAAASLDVRGARVSAPPLRLGVRFRVAGRVVDAQGNGVKARVVASLAPGVKPWPAQAASPWEPSATEELLLPAAPAHNPSDWMLGLDSEADGSFSVPVAVKGPVVLEALTDCARVKSAVVKNGAAAIELRLPPLATLEGRVLTPSSSATVRLRELALDCSRREVVVALTDGRFSLSGIPVGTWDVELEVAGFASWWSRVKLAGGKTTQVGEVRLTRGATLVGRVLNREGKPLGSPVATVGVRAPDREPRNYPVRADGTFEVTGLTPGKVTVAGELELGDHSPLQHVVLVEGQRVEVELRFVK